MKKIITILMAAAIMVSLAACGGGNSNNDTPSGNDSTPSGGNDTPTTQGDTTTPGTETQAQGLAIGEMATTDLLEFALTDFRFFESYATYEKGVYIDNPQTDLYYPLISAAEYGSSGYIPPTDGNVFLFYSWSVKNIGKEEPSYLYKFELDYNDGYKYTFENNKTMYKSDVDGLWYSPVRLDSLQPLSPAREFIGCIEVPKEVRDNADTPLKFILSLGDSDDKVATFTYVIR